MIVTGGNVGILTAFGVRVVGPPPKRETSNSSSLLFWWNILNKPTSGLESHEFVLTQKTLVSYYR